MIDDLTATQYFNELDTTADEAERERKLVALREYTDAREQEEDRVNQDHFEKIYTDPAYFNSFADSDATRAAEDASLHPSEVRYELANRAYLSYLKGRELDGEYYAQRDGYAREYFGKPETSDKEFFESVKGEFEFNQKRRAAAADLNSQAVKHVFDDAMTGTPTPFTDKFTKWKEANKDLLDDEQDMPYLEGAMRVYDQVRADIAELGPAGARIRDVVTKFTEGDLDEGALQVLGRELVALTPEQRQKIYRYAALAAQADKKGMGAIEQAAINLGQSISRGFSFLEGPSLTGTDKTLRYAYTPLSTIERLGRVRLMQLDREKDSPEKAAEIAAIAETQEMVKVVRELKDVAKTQIDPVKPIMPEGTFLGTAERGIYGLGGSVGVMAATGVNPALGYLAIADGEYENLRTEFPNLDPNVAGVTALASAAIQAPIEMLQLRALRGMPLTGQVLSDIKTGILGTAARIGANVTEQNIQEGIQDAVSMGIPLVLSALREDMPDKDPFKVFNAYMKQRGEVFFAVLPLGLVGGGMASLNDYAKGGQDLIEARKLGYAGFDRKQAAAIINAPPEQRDAVIQGLWQQRTPENIAKGITAFEKDFDAAQKLQADPDMPTLERTTLPDGSIEYRVTRSTSTEVDPAKHVTVRTSVAPEGTEFEAKSVPVKQAYTEVNRNINSYRAVVDCLVGK